MVLRRCGGDSGGGGVTVAMVTLLPHHLRETWFTSQAKRVVFPPRNADIMTTARSLFRTCAFRASVVPIIRPSYQCIRHGSSASSTRWLNRQSNDHYNKQAKVLRLRSRAAFKLLEINENYGLFKPRMTVVDLVSSLLPVCYRHPRADTNRATHQAHGARFVFAPEPLSRPRSIITSAGRTRWR